MVSESPLQKSPSASESVRALLGKRPLSTTNVDRDEENRRKDPKISRACDTCKRKKIRCDGILPCSNCAKRRLHCAYDAKYGRGRPPTPPPSTAIDERQQRPRSDNLNDLISGSNQHVSLMMSQLHKCFLAPRLKSKSRVNMLTVPRD